MRRALLTAINAYPTAPLRGCLNDIKNVAAYLVNNCGFNHSDIRLLVDDRATTKAYREHLNWFVEGVKPTDYLVYWNSSHGSQIVDRDFNGKVIAIHDCVCPVDFDFTKENAITDDDYMEVFGRIPEGTNFRWGSDSCHSGDLAREMFCSLDDDPEYRVPRMFPIPLDYMWRIQTAVEMGLRAIGFVRAIEHLNGTFISGCKSNQTSADAYISNEYCGAMTHYFFKVLQKNSSLQMPDIVDNMRLLLKENGYDQVPQLHGRDMQDVWYDSTMVKE